MRARFHYIGKISWARQGKRKKDTIYFGLTTWRHTPRGKVRVEYNNNFTLLSEKGKYAKEKFKMGNTVLVEGYIITTQKNGVQDCRFIVTNYIILHDFEDVELNHIEKYYDLPPEEFYDTFDDGVGFMPEGKNLLDNKSNLLND